MDIFEKEKEEMKKEYEKIIEENNNKFLKEIVEFCRDNSIILFH